ncbi:MAG: NAD(P)/FAD-dependent oxidoreductase [Bacillati bacterium ANGP1]|uniref:NAD(P)/FAD-dependent oxidoreductase n=1 Tax=Candidatus Segetimicrobium genomatis TaxID=2569760 RepID=A0A537J1K6_9BACT|nr:MAG: NAD(P)/FAD-dependent oxidoreductase [Terrabacteria group bacterium ANGP1]
MSLDADVIVVGAGPAGSTAAALLAAAGVRVLVVDRATFPRDKPCGDYCNPGAVNLLRDAGALPAVFDTGASAISGMRVYAQDGSRFEARFPVGHGLLIPRLRLDAALLGHASRAGAAICEGVAVDSVRSHPEAVEVRTASGRRWRARLLIAADGMHSAIARRLGRLILPAAGRYTVGAYFSGLVQTAPGGELHLGPGMYGGVAHFGSGVANVCMALPRRLWRHAGPRQTFDAALTSLPALAEAMAGARRESRFRCSGPVGFADRNAVADRILLIGDAGGQIEPMTGQGIFLALRSAHLASGVAAEALSTDDLSYRKLFTYAQHRRREIAGRLAVSRWLQRLAFHPQMTPLLVRRLRMRPELAGDLLGATGDVLPPGGILSPAYLARLFL